MALKWIDPMLATLTEKYFSSPDWLYEHKFDGERILAYKDGNKIELYTRNKKSANQDYPEIVKAIKKQKAKSFILDGEVIAQQNGKSNFSLMQKVMHASGAASDIIINYYIFDILYLNNKKVTDLELLARKKLLKNNISFFKPLKFTEHILKNGLEYFKLACKKKWEGIIAKNIHSKYESRRSKNWLKFKCVQQQELVIVGYTNPQGSRINFGAILVGYYKNKKLIYAGKVGTGFDEETLKELGAELKKLKQSKSPFDTTDIDSRSVNWVKPKLVAEIKFSEWTSYGKLRHPRFMGLRRDKSAKLVVKES